jgi:hypothetical protein
MSVSAPWSTNGLSLNSYYIGISIGPEGSKTIRGQRYKTYKAYKAIGQMDIWTTKICAT